MTSQERKTLKRKMKIQYWIAYLLGIGGTAIYITLMLTLVAPLETEGMTDSQEMWALLIYISPIILLPMIALGFGMSAGWKSRELMSEFKRLYDVKNRRYFRRFYEAVTASDLELARKRFNLIAVRADTYKVFAHGILITLMRMSGMEENVREAEERMSGIL